MKEKRIRTKDKIEEEDIDLKFNVYQR